MLLVDDLAAGGTKNLRHTPRGLVTLYRIYSDWVEFLKSVELTKEVNEKISGLQLS